VTRQLVHRVSLWLAALFVFSSSLPAQQHAAPLPREGTRKVLENDFVAVWDVTWEKGKSTGPQKRRFDQATVTLSEGAIKTTRSDKTWTVEQSRVGTVQFESKGTVAAEEGISDNPRRAIIVEFKSYATPKLEPDVARQLKEKGVPGQFAREGAVKLFENERLIVWDNRYTIGRGVLHAHYNQVVGVWIEPGVLGNSPREIGQVQFRAPGPPHQEEAQSSLRAIFFEYK
jgi:hypothetical protein